MANPFKKRKMKIVFCMYRIITGGIEICLLRILEAMVKNKSFNITIVSRFPVEEKRFLDFFKKNHIKLKVLPPKYTLKENSTLFQKLLHKYRKHSIKTVFKGYDIIIDYFNGGYVNELKKNKSKKLAFMHLGSQKFLARLKNEYQQIINTYDKIICLTDTFKNEVVAKYPDLKEKIIRIYNPIDAKQIQKLASSEYDKKLSGEKYFTFVGRLDIDKDHKTVIEAFKKFVDKNPAGKLYLIGDGPLRKYYENFVNSLLLQDNIIFLGTLDNPLNYVKYAKANILSSPSEGLPTVMLEAACLHTLNIASDCPDGPREILLNGLAGMLFPVKDTEKLSKILDDVWNDRVDVKSLIKKSDEMLNRFDYDKIVSQLINLFSSTEQKKKTIDPKYSQIVTPSNQSKNNNLLETVVNMQNTIKELQTMCIRDFLLVGHPQFSKEINSLYPIPSSFEVERNKLFDCMVWRQLDISFDDLSRSFRNQFAISTRKWIFFEKYISFLIIHGDIGNNVLDVFEENIAHIDLWTEKTLLLFIMYGLYTKQQKLVKLFDFYVQKFGIGRVHEFFPIAKFSIEHGISNEKIIDSANLWDAFHEHTNDFENLIKGKKVALVGNGPQEVGSGNGKIIDSYDVVIRMNKYIINHKTEKDYGKKVTIWVNCEPIPEDLSLKGNFQLCVWLCNFYAASWYNLAITSKKLNQNKKVSSLDMMNLWKEVYQKTGIYCPSNGLNLIYLIKKINPDFSADDCFGFSFKEQNLSKNPEWGHYAGEKLFNMPHDLYKEQSAIWKIFNNSGDIDVTK